MARRRERCRVYERLHCAQARCAERTVCYGGAMAKGIERGKKQNKPKLSTKEKQKKKKEKAARKG